MLPDTIFFHHHYDSTQTFTSFIKTNQPNKYYKYFIISTLNSSSILLRRNYNYKDITLTQGRAAENSSKDHQKMVLLKPSSVIILI